MKLDVAQLKKAIQWIETNSRDVCVDVSSYDGSKTVIKCMDKYESEVEIVLYKDSEMLPKIRKTEVLK